MWGDAGGKVLCKTENEWKTDENETKRDGTVAEEKPDNALKGADAGLESKIDRTLPLLWSNVQHPSTGKVSLLHNENAIPVDEPKKPEEKLQLGEI